MVFRIGAYKTDAGWRGLCFVASGVDAQRHTLGVYESRNDALMAARKQAFALLRAKALCWNCGSIAKAEGLCEQCKTGFDLDEWALQHDDE